MPGGIEKSKETMRAHIRQDGGVPAIAVPDLEANKSGAPEERFDSRTRKVMQMDKRGLAPDPIDASLLTPAPFRVGNREDERRVLAHERPDLPQQLLRPRRMLQGMVAEDRVPLPLRDVVRCLACVWIPCAALKTEHPGRAGHVSDSAAVVQDEPAPKVTAAAILAQALDAVQKLGGVVMPIPAVAECLGVEPLEEFGTGSRPSEGTMAGVAARESELLPAKLPGVSIRKPRDRIRQAVGTGRCRFFSIGHGASRFRVERMVANPAIRTITSSRHPIARPILRWRLRSRAPPSRRRRSRIYDPWACPRWREPEIKRAALWRVCGSGCNMRNRTARSVRKLDRRCQDLDAGASQD